MTQDDGEDAAAAAARPSEPTPPDDEPAPPDNGGRRPHALLDVCLELRQRVQAFLAEEPAPPLLRRLQARIRASMSIVDEALAWYPPEVMSVSYNGGKDCLVLLVLVLVCLARRRPKPTDSPPSPHLPSPPPFPDKIQAVYIVSQHPFPEVDDFVAESAADYHIDISRYALPMKQGLEAYLADRPDTQAIFVGTRRTDPHARRLQYFDPTDVGWPKFMRVHPVIDWHYADIWAFILRFRIPYCPLYDLGYTSLGGRLDTHPNPVLKRKEGENKGEFRPAYELIDDREERLGRD